MFHRWARVNMSVCLSLSLSLHKFQVSFFGFFVFNGISTLFRLFNAKAILPEEQ